MATKNDENWMMHYNELKAYVAVHHHFPVRHTTLNNWIRYQRKRIVSIRQTPSCKCHEVFSENLGDFQRYL